MRGAGGCGKTKASGSRRQWPGHVRREVHPEPTRARPCSAGLRVYPDPTPTLPVAVLKARGGLPGEGRRPAEARRGRREMRETPGRTDGETPNETWAQGCGALVRQKAETDPDAGRGAHGGRQGTRVDPETTTPAQRQRRAEAAPETLTSPGPTSPPGPTHRGRRPRGAG